jgi:pimeloyl-ACP methyl ester carboxylesterase
MLMDVDLYVRESGAGVPLVLLHAFPLNSAMWLAQREGLADSCRVITPDFRGFGGSPSGVDDPSLDVLADDIVRLLDTRELDRVVLGGLSMGGYVAMAFVRRYADRLLGLILADTKASADPGAARDNRLRMADALAADSESTVLLDEVLPNLIGPTTMEKRPLVYGRVKALVQQAPAAAAAWAQRAMAARPDSFDALRGVTAPALVIVGDEDALSKAEDAQAMVDALPSGHSIQITGSGHLTAVEMPDEFNKAMRDFVGALS